MATVLEVGGKAPDFAMDTTAGPATLSSFAGRYLVLYFYPRDDTPGCTEEAAGFTRNIDAFAAARAAILGVSRDTLRKHHSFMAKHALGIPLASDADGRVCEAYGTWEEKAMYGRTYMGIARRTFLIGPDGRILRIWPKVKVKGHAEEVLSALA